MILLYIGLWAIVLGAYGAMLFPSTLHQQHDNQNGGHPNDD
jgi:hypothetical protein